MAWVQTAPLPFGEGRSWARGDQHRLTGDSFVATPVGGRHGEIPRRWHPSDATESIRSARLVIAPSSLAETAHKSAEAR